MSKRSQLKYPITRSQQQQLSHFSQVFVIGYMNQEDNYAWIEQCLHSFRLSNILFSLKSLASTCSLIIALLTYPTLKNSASLHHT